MKLFKEVQKEKKKKKTYVSSPSEDNNSDDDMSLTEKCKRKVARDKAKISTRKNNKKKRTIIITSDDDDQDDNNDDNNNNKTNRRKVIDSEDSEENQSPRININEKNSIDEDDDEIEFVGRVPAELSTIIRSNYRVKGKSSVLERGVRCTFSRCPVQAFRPNQAERWLRLTQLSQTEVSLILTMN